MIGVSFPGVFSSSPFTYSLNPSVWFLTTHLIPPFLMFLYFQASSLPTSITVILKIITPTCVPVLGMAEGGSKLIKMSPFYRMGWLVWGEPYFSLSINPLLDPLLIYNGKKKIPMLTPEWIGRGLPLVEPPVKCGQASVIYEKSLAQTC